MNVLPTQSVTSAKLRSLDSLGHDNPAVEGSEAGHRKSTPLVGAVDRLKPETDVLAYARPQQMAPTPAMAAPPYFDSNIAAGDRRQAKIRELGREAKKQMEAVFDALSSTDWQKNPTYRAIVDHLSRPEMPNNAAVVIAENLVICRKGLSVVRKMQIKDHLESIWGDYSDRDNVTDMLVMLPLPEAKRYDDCLMWAWQFGRHELEVTAISARLDAVGSILHIEQHYCFQSDVVKQRSILGVRQALNIGLCLPCEILCLPFRVHQIYRCIKDRPEKSKAIENKWAAIGEQQLRDI